MKRIPYPVIWITFGLLLIACASTLPDPLSMIGWTLYLTPVLIIILFYQWLVQKFTREKIPRWIRRCIMLTPAALFAVWIIATQSIWTEHREIIRLATGKYPLFATSEVHLHEESWTDYIAFLYLEADPEKIRQLLESGNLEKDDYTPPLEIIRESLAHLEGKLNAKPLILYRKPEKPGVFCKAWTNSDYEFLFIEYSVD